MSDGTNERQKEKVVRGSSTGRRDRHRFAIPCGGGVRRLGCQTGAYVLDVHQRPPSLGRMAQGAGHCDGGDGIDRRVLDPGVRDPSGSGSGSGVGQRAKRQDRSRSQDRRQRCTVAPTTAPVRTAARELPSLAGGCGIAGVSAPSRTAVGLRRGPRPAHAQGADAR